MPVSDAATPVGKVPVVVPSNRYDPEATPVASKLAISPELPVTPNPKAETPVIDRAAAATIASYTLVCGSSTVGEKLTAEAAAPVP